MLCRNFARTAPLLGRQSTKNHGKEVGREKRKRKM